MNQQWKKQSPSSKEFKRNTKTNHHVQYTDAAIEAAATLSNRYIQDRFLPDKAIDLLDEAGSKMNLTLNFVDPKVIDQRLIEAENLKSQATREEDFEKAAYFRDQIAKYKEMQRKRLRIKIFLSSARKLLSILSSRKPIFLLVIWKRKNNLNSSI